MSLELLIYLAEVSGSVSCLLGFVSLTLVLSVIIYSVFAPIENLFKWSVFATLASLALILGFTSALLPSKTTIYSIAAIKMGKEISKNEKVIETSDKIYKLLNQKLDEVLKQK